MKTKPGSSHNRNHWEESTDSLLRPRSWPDYIGQQKIKNNLQLMIEAAKKRNEPVDHLLFYGQTGLGKTTLARLVAKAAGRPIKITTGPTIERIGDLAAILSNLEPYDTLFIDEAHRLNRSVEEAFYPAMETREFHIVIGKGIGARTIALNLPPFTFIAATTRPDLISSPLRSRFGAIFHLDYYSEADIKKIIERSAAILKIKVTPRATEILARASRFTPRVANRLLKRARDYIQVEGREFIEEEAARKTLEILDIDEVGLERHDRMLIAAIVERFEGGPVGLNNLAAVLNEDQSIIENVYEPYLIKIGLIKRTASGRVVEPRVLERLNLKNIK